MRRLALAIALAVVALGVVTLVALEGREVVVVVTTDASGKSRRTRTWIADDDGVPIVEAANPERPFLVDLRRAPDLVLERGGARFACRAEILPNPEGHERVRRLLAFRYGWADRWIGLVADTDASLGVRLDCS
jgi:hypothetical protein